MDNILTICCLGTNEYFYEDAPSLVTKFAMAVDGPVCVLDGPGAKIFNGKKLSLLTRMRGLLFGYGIQENIEKAFKIILPHINRMQIQHPGQPLVINMLGYSRGAVTCLRLANALEQYFVTQFCPQTLPEINLVLVDPVAGLFEKHRPASRFIPFFVKNCYAFLALDEFRLAFTPQDGSRLITRDPVSTCLQFLPLPGPHSLGTSVLQSEYEEVTLLVHQFVKNQFESWGTQFKNDRALLMSKEKSPLELLELYAHLHEEREAYRKMGSTGVLTKPRRLVKRLEEYVLDATYFMNQHHRELFKFLYPAVFNYYFENHAEFENKIISETEICAQLNLFALRAPSSYKHLIRHFIANQRGATAEDLQNGISGTLVTLPRGGPAGYQRVEPCALRNGLSLARTKNELLAFSVIEMVHVYRRERLRLFFRNTHHLLAENLKRKVRALLLQPVAERDEFQEKLFLILRHYHQKLEKLGGVSRLYSYLTTLLGADLRVKRGFYAYVGLLCYRLSRFMRKDSPKRKTLKRWAYHLLAKAPTHIVNANTTPAPLLDWSSYSSDYSRILQQRVQTGLRPVALPSVQSVSRLSQASDTLDVVDGVDAIATQTPVTWVHTHLPNAFYPN